MMRLLWLASLAALALGPFAALPEERVPMSDAIPRSVAAYAAEAAPLRYDRATVYDYMDGGAEVYLAYGMKTLWAQTYARSGEPPITLNLFEMDGAAGAFGVFTYEREDEEAGIGQGSEYGGGILRFWQGSSFVFVQAESETPKAREAVLALGKAVASHLGPTQESPGLPKALPAEGLRPFSVRYVRSPLLLEAFERAALGNPLGLPQRCEAVLGRYGPKGSTQRILVARFSDESAAKKGVQGFLKAKAPGPAKPGEPFQADGGWSVAAASGPFAALVLGAPDGAEALRRLRETTDKLKEVVR